MLWIYTTAVESRTQLAHWSLCMYTWGELHFLPRGWTSDRKGEVRRVEQPGVWIPFHMAYNINWMVQLGTNGNICYICSAIATAN